MNNYLRGTISLRWKRFKNSISPPLSSVIPLILFILASLIFVLMFGISSIPSIPIKESLIYLQSINVALWVGQAFFVAQLESREKVFFAKGLYAKKTGLLLSVTLIALSSFSIAALEVYAFPPVVIKITVLLVTALTMFIVTSIIFLIFLFLYPNKFYQFKKIYISNKIEQQSISLQIFQGRFYNASNRTTDILDNNNITFIPILEYGRSIFVNDSLSKDYIEINITRQHVFVRPKFRRLNKLAQWLQAKQKEALKVMSNKIDAKIGHGIHYDEKRTPISSPIIFIPKLYLGKNIINQQELEQFKAELNKCFWHRKKSAYKKRASRLTPYFNDLITQMIDLLKSDHLTEHNLYLFYMKILHDTYSKNIANFSRDLRFPYIREIWPDKSYFTSFYDWFRIYYATLVATSSLLNDEDRIKIVLSTPYRILHIGLEHHDGLDRQKQAIFEEGIKMLAILITHTEQEAINELKLHQKKALNKLHEIAEELFNDPNYQGLFVENTPNTHNLNRDVLHLLKTEKDVLKFLYQKNLLLDFKNSLELFFSQTTKSRISPWIYIFSFDNFEKTIDVENEVWELSDMKARFCLQQLSFIFCLAGKIYHNEEGNNYSNRKEYLRLLYATFPPHLHYLAYVYCYSKLSEYIKFYGMLQKFFIDYILNSNKEQLNLESYIKSPNLPPWPGEKEKECYVEFLAYYPPDFKEELRRIKTEVKRMQDLGEKQQENRNKLVKFCDVVIDYNQNSPLH